MKKFTLALSPTLCFVLLFTQPALPTGIMIAFRRCPHDCNKSKCAQIEWHFQPASSADGVDVECNYQPGNTSGSGALPTLSFTQHLTKIAQIKSHTAARCPPGLYGDLHKRYCFSSLTRALVHYAPSGGPGTCSGLLHRPMLLLFHHILRNRRALGYRQEELGGVSQGTLPMP